MLLSLACPQELATHNVAPFKGVLLHGRAGIGKTLRAQGVADTEYPTPQGTGRLTFLFRSSADVFSKWVREDERTLREIFQEAPERAPSIIVF